MDGGLVLAVVLTAVMTAMLVLRGMRVSRFAHDLRAEGRPLSRGVYVFWVLAVGAVGVAAATWLIVLLN